MRTTSLLTAALCFAILAGSGAAQCTLGGGMVDLKIDGVVATGQVLDVTVGAGGSSEIALTDLTGASGDAFILAAGPSIACQSIFLAWGSTFDVAAPGIVLNGIAPATPMDMMAVTDFSITFPVDCAAAGSNGPALQAVHVAPALAPFFLHNTGAIQASYVDNAPVSVTFENWGDDAAVLFNGASSCGIAGVPMVYGGVAYQDIYISSNGPLTFTGGTNDFSASTAELFSGWGSGYPGVAPRWEDMSRSSALNDKVIVTQDVANGTVEFDFQGMEHWGSGAPLGDWKCTFGLAGPGSVVIDLTNALPGGVCVAAKFIEDCCNCVPDGCLHQFLLCRSTPVVPSGHGSP